MKWAHGTDVPLRNYTAPLEKYNTL